MKKFIIYFIFFILILAGISVKVKSNSFSNPSDIVVTNKIINVLPNEHNFIGANWQVDFPPNKDIFSNPEHIKAFIEALKNTGIDIVRYPGGQDIAMYFWDVPNETIVTAMKNWKKSNNKVVIYSYIKPSDRVDFYSFMKFCRKADIKATVQVNTHTFFDKSNNTIIPLKTFTSRDSEGNRIISSGNVNYSLVQKAAKNAAAQVKWVKDNGHSDIVKYWELGNEEFIKGVETNSAYSGAEYGQIAAEFIKKMKQVDPNIKFILTNQMRSSFLGEKPVYLNAAYINNWSTEVLNNTDLKSEASSIYAAAYHVYSNGKTNTNTSFKAFYDNALDNPEFNISEKLNFHKKNLNKLGYKNTGIFVNEFNSNNFKSSYSHTWAGAIGNARIMLTGANTPYCKHTDYFNLMHGYWIINDVYANKGFEMLHYAKDFKMPFIIHPVGNVIKLLNENIQYNVLNTQVTNPDITVVSSQNGDKLNIIVLNIHSAKNISLKLDGFSKIKYIGNKSIGNNVPADFTVLNTSDSASDPSEIRLLNTLDNAFAVNKRNEIYEFNLPKNNIAVLTFKIYSN